MSCPSSDTVNDKTYPIARDLYMYTAGEPTGAIKNIWIGFFHRKPRRSLPNWVLCR